MAAQQLRYHMRAMLLCALALCPLACSKVLDWNPNGLPCDTTVRDGYTYFCQSGYSCETASLKCLRDKSVSTSQLCTLSRQCQSGDVCPVDVLGWWRHPLRRTMC